jgi:hypothetical protein
MSSPWPAPDADEAVGSGRAPNYLLRRIAAAVVAVAVIGGGVVVVKRLVGGDDGGSTSAAGEARSWDTIVVQDNPSRTVHVLDRDGEELTSVETDLLGVTDVGLDGKVVLGLAGGKASDGLAVLDLGSGELTDLTVHHDNVSPIGDSGFLLSTDGTNSGGSELVEVATGATTDLLDLVDSDVDDPLLVPASIRVDERRSHLAFTEFRSNETYVLSLDDLEADPVSVAGSLVAIAFDRVVTLTNRGDSVLLDLSTFEGERVGTVEVPSPAAAMLVDGSHAIVVGRAGAVSSVDFGEETVDDVVDLAPDLPTAPGASADDPLISTGIAIASNSRLALFGERFVAFVGPDGRLVKSIDQAESMLPRSVDPEDRCLVLFGSASPPVFIDVERGSIIGALTDQLVTRASHDGCTVVTTPSAKTAAPRVVGSDIDDAIEVDQRFLALSDDGTAALVTGKPGSATPTSVMLLPDGAPIDLGTTSLLAAAFAHR